jgi:hypothetical protein
MTALPSPAGLHKAASTSTSITLGWTNGDGTAQTEVYRDGALVTTVAAGVSGYADGSLTAFSGYSYRIRHVKAGGLYSPLSIAVPMFTSLPVPASLTATPSGTDVHVVWSNTTGVADIEITRDGVHLTTVSAGGSDYFDLALPDGNYSYQVRYVVPGDSGAYGGLASATVDVIPDNPPSGVSAVASSPSEIDLTWTNSSADQVQVFRGTSPSPTTLIATVGSGLTTYADTGLAAATTYYYRLKHVRAGVPSASYTADVSATTSVAPLAAPGSFNIDTPFTDRAALGWTPGGAYSTEVYRGPAPNPTTLLATVSSGIDAYNDDTVVTGSLYYYRVRHVLGGSSSGYVSGSVTLPAPSVTVDGVNADQTTNLVGIDFSVVVGPRGATVSLSWSCTPSGGSGSADNVSGGYEADPGLDIKHFGVGTEQTFSVSVSLKDAGGSVVATAFGGTTFYA